MRLAASDATLVAMAVPPQKPSPPQEQRPRTRDPILGGVPETVLPRAQTAVESGPGIFRFGAREYPFPERGSIHMIGSSSGKSGHSNHQKKLEYEIWQEAQERARKERTLRTVVVHGRSLPPWIGQYHQMSTGLTPFARSYLPG